MQARVDAHSPTQVSGVAVQTEDLEFAHELLSENYAAHRPHYRGSRRFHLSLSSPGVAGGRSRPGQRRPDRPSLGLHHTRPVR
jgi:hypothetical protein